MSRGLGCGLSTASMSAWFSDGQKPAGPRLQDNWVGVFEPDDRIDDNEKFSWRN